MAIRLNPDRLLGLLIFVLFLAWAVLTAMGCAADNTGVDLSDKITTTTTVPVSTGDVAGDVSVFTFAGATPWTLAGALGLLWAFQTWRKRTATGALDRVIGQIRDHEDSAKEENRNIDYEVIRTLQACIERASDRIVTCPDRHERLIRKRLARMKK